jgi:hypothetical protein
MFKIKMAGEGRMGFKFIRVSVRQDTRKEVRYKVLIGMEDN